LIDSLLLLFILTGVIADNHKNLIQDNRPFEILGVIPFLRSMMFTSVNLQPGEEGGGVNVGKWVFCQTWQISECVVIKHFTSALI